MNRYILIRRLRGPAFLLLIGVIALMHQMGLVSHFWRLIWPLALILLGVLLLAERAALAADGDYPPYPAAPDSSSGTGIPAYPGQPTAIVPTHSYEHTNDHEGEDS